MSSQICLTREAMSRGVYKIFDNIEVLERSIVDYSLTLGPKDKHFRLCMEFRDSLKSFLKSMKRNEENIELRIFEFKEMEKSMMKLLLNWMELYDDLDV